MVEAEGAVVEAVVKSSGGSDENLRFLDATDMDKDELSFLRDRQKGKLESRV